MRISIAERLKPFSHIPGFSFLLPGSNFRFQIFPALIRVHDLSQKEPIFITEIGVDIKGPVRDFTVLQDLEKGCILVWGHTATGYIRYKIIAAEGQPYFYITVEKEEDNLNWTASNGFRVLRCQLSEEIKKTFIVSDLQEDSAPSFYKAVAMERLSLGNHKAQDWSSIHKHVQMEEIFPLWIHLGQMLSLPKYMPLGGTTELLEECRGKIGNREVESIILGFTNLFRAGFEGGLSPRLHDDQHQGYMLPPIRNDVNAGVTPLQLLVEGAALIRSLFVKCEEERVAILPMLPPELHCGRFLGVKCQLDGVKGVLDIEWSKKLIRRMVFKAETDGEMRFCFQKEIKRFRVRQKESESGKIIECSGVEIIKVSSGKQYLFDRFEK